MKLIYAEYDVKNYVLYNEKKNHDNFEFRFSAEDEMSVEGKLDFIRGYDPKYDEIIKELESFANDLEGGVIKERMYGGIHMGSAKKYCLGLNHLYTKEEYSYGSSSNAVRFTIVKKKKYFDSKWQLMKVIEQVKDVDALFHSILFDLEKKESETHSEWVKENYKEEHAKTIEIGSMIKELCDAFRVGIGIGLSEKKKVFSDEYEFDVIHGGLILSSMYVGSPQFNSYSELLDGKNGNPVSYEEAKRVYDLLIEYGCKINGLCMELNRLLKGDN